MIEFGNLEIEGFCSIGSYTLNLSKSGITVIRGRNGSGKTTLISAISWVLYGVLSKETKKGVNTWERYRPKDYRGTKVSIYWSSKGSVHNVIRCSNYTGEVYGSKGKDRLIYLIDNEHVPSKKKPEIQELIKKNLGMSIDLFRNSIMFGQGLRRLVQESGSDKKDLFEEVFDIAYLSEAQKLSKTLLKTKQEELTRLVHQSSSLNKLFDEYKSTYRSLKKQSKGMADRVAKEISLVQDKILKAEKSIKEADIESNRLANTLSKKERIEKSLSELRAELKENSKKLQVFQDNEGISIFIDNLIKLIDENKISKVKEDLASLKESLVFINQYNKKTERLNSRLNLVNEDIYEEKLRVQEYKYQAKALEKYKSRVKELNNSPDITSEEYKKYREKYTQLKPEIEELSEKQESLKKEVENYKWLIDDPLGNKGIKSYIIENMLSKLNDILKSFSSRVGFKVEFSIDLESARKDFYTLIEIDNNIVDYSELSGGQKQLVNVVMAFAMHEMTSMSKGVNILFLDEVFESLDSENIEVLVSMIRGMTGKSIYIITHLDSLPISNSTILKLGYSKGLTQFQ